MPLAVLYSTHLYLLVMTHWNRNAQSNTVISKDKTRQSKLTMPAFLLILFQYITESAISKYLLL